MKLTNFTPTILGIDTSCDDTSAAVVRGQVVLSNVVASQTQLHQPYGGVFPTVAKQAHLANIYPTIEIALKRAQVTWDGIDAIAITIGPGLAPALEVGVETVKTIAAKKNKKVIAINHMEGHAFSGLLVSHSRQQAVPEFPPKISWPILAVTVSGGHTEFVKIDGLREFKVLGKTIDDAAGECLDKVGRMLNLGYPAGPVMEEFAKLGNSKRYPFPLPMTTTNSSDMSFSGLKTAARNLLQELTSKQDLSKQELYDFAASFQARVFDHICNKLTKLLKNDSEQQYSQVLLGGGVAANMTLRKMLRKTLKPFSLTLTCPINKRVCGDNGAMIALVGALNFSNRANTDYKSLERLPRLHIGEKI